MDYICCMIKKIVFCTAFILPFISKAQDYWDLKRCVEYAIENNISVKQADVQARLQILQAKQTKANRIPSLAFSSNGGYQFGRSVNPSTYEFTNNTIFQQTYNLQSSITLFNWFNIKNTIISNQKNAEALEQDINRAKSDVTLNVAAAYLQLLLSKEQVNIAKTQIDLTQQQLDLTRKKVDAGSLPELNAAQLASQFATDSSTYITNVSQMEQNKLQLFALLNLSADARFEFGVPDAEKIPLLPISDLQPKELYETALANQYLQKVDSLKIEGAKYNIKAAKGAMFPTITAFAGIGSNFADNYSTLTGVRPFMDTIGSVNVQGSNYSVTSMNGVPIYSKAPYFKQIFNLNLNQSVGLSLNVPIFNYRQLRTNYERAKENLHALELQKEQDNLTLQQNIYTAYNNALTGIQNFSANTKAADYASYAYSLSQKRYDIGMLTTSDFLVVQNNMYQAKIKQVASRFEYIFRLKVLEFYKNNSISL
ncbi:MAG: TolC family protein [Pseudopedobacter saltans]|uniref:TolC family protein n=1 Tax=Pseudopedobacter saltans TaxID=151895 RepID=A0A2W5EVT8_9SPHI|nr:MAG: TolC family protein [Pseudopedobacter saltans]